MVLRDGSSLILLFLWEKEILPEDGIWKIKIKKEYHFIECWNAVLERE